MGVKGIIEATRRIFKLVTMPNWREFSLLLRVIAIGVTVVGLYGFIINMIAFGLTSMSGVFVPPIVAVVAVLFVFVFGVVFYVYGRRKGWW